eukprot:TRINITY_DN26600_c0_g1_i1.p1 TRINITY_DN26600_c0_g1~~TRINITY_DN26600_c0_g1_i1.p1  ORF type:complete len:1056 (-),score=277.88 TRINITY_DN26600_c0_g1_i1:216-3383(-)
MWRPLRTVVLRSRLANRLSSLEASVGFAQRFRGITSSEVGSSPTLADASVRATSLGASVARKSPRRLCIFGVRCNEPHCVFPHPQGRFIDGNVSQVSPAPPTHGVAQKADAGVPARRPRRTSAAAELALPASIDEPALSAPPTPAADADADAARLPPSAPRGAALCRYGTGCLRPDCMYYHPNGRQIDARASERGAEAGRVAGPPRQREPCRFGSRCRRPGCPFTHPWDQYFDAAPESASASEPASEGALSSGAGPTPSASPAASQTAASASSTAECALSAPDSSRAAQLVDDTSYESAGRASDSAVPPIRKSNAAPAVSPDLAHPADLPNRSIEGADSASAASSVVPSPPAPDTVHAVAAEPAPPAKKKKTPKQPKKAKGKAAAAAEPAEAPASAPSTSSADASSATASAHAPVAGVSAGAHAEGPAIDSALPPTVGSVSAIGDSAAAGVPATSSADAPVVGGSAGASADASVTGSDSVVASAGADVAAAPGPKRKGRRKSADVVAEARVPRVVEENLLNASTPLKANKKCGLGKKCADPTCPYDHPPSRRAVRRSFGEHPEQPAMTVGDVLAAELREEARAARNVRQATPCRDDTLCSVRLCPYAHPNGRLFDAAEELTEAANARGWEDTEVDLQPPAAPEPERTPSRGPRHPLDDPYDTHVQSWDSGADASSQGIPTERRRSHGRYSQPSAGQALPIVEYVERTFAAGAALPQSMELAVSSVHFQSFDVSREAGAVLGRADEAQPVPDGKLLVDNIRTFARAGLFDAVSKNLEHLVAAHSGGSLIAEATIELLGVLCQQPIAAVAGLRALELVKRHRWQYPDRALFVSGLKAHRDIIQMERYVLLLQTIGYLPDNEMFRELVAAAGRCADVSRIVFYYTQMLSMGIPDNGVVFAEVVDALIGARKAAVVFELEPRLRRDVARLPPSMVLNMLRAAGHANRADRIADLFDELTETGDNTAKAVAAAVGAAARCGDYNAVGWYLTFMHLQQMRMSVGIARALLGGLRSRPDTAAAAVALWDDIRLLSSDAVGQKPLSDDDAIKLEAFVSSLPQN